MSIRLQSSVQPSNAHSSRCVVPQGEGTLLHPRNPGKAMEAAGCVGACVLEQGLLSRGLLCCCGQWPDFLVQAHYSVTELSAHISSSSETSLCFVERSPVSKVPDFKEREV